MAHKVHEVNAFALIFMIAFRVSGGILVGVSDLPRELDTT